MPHAIWRANQMASCRTAVTSSGHPLLDAELPNGGWPGSALIELLVQQAGIGEMQLLKPALATIARKGRIVLVQPPYLPQLAAWSAWGLPTERLLWIKTSRSADAWWSAEQILRNGSCGALLFWQTHARAESLRRLHLLAQAAEIVFWMIRPLAGAQDSSPALLRLGLRPARGGVQIDIVKRRGPQRAGGFHQPLCGMPAVSAMAAETEVVAVLNNQDTALSHGVSTYFLHAKPTAPNIFHHAHVDRHTSAAIGAGNLPTTLV
jgi:protein ImuA